LAARCGLPAVLKKSVNSCGFVWQHGIQYTPRSLSLPPLPPPLSLSEGQKGERKGGVSGGQVEDHETLPDCLSERIVFRISEGQRHQMHTGGWLCGAHRARASTACTMRLHAHACEGVGENAR
jgi:hypothetical protein